jgi:hypothetical protein
VAVDAVVTGELPLPSKTPFGVKLVAPVPPEPTASAFERLTPEKVGTAVGFKD